MPWFTQWKNDFGFDQSFKNIARLNLVGIEADIFYALLFGIIMWWFLENTRGRYLFATGGNREAARLAGVSTNFYITRPDSFRHGGCLRRGPDHLENQ